MKRDSKGGRGKANKIENTRICILKAAGIPSTTIGKFYGISDARVHQIWAENKDNLPILRVLEVAVDSALDRV